MIQIQCIGAKAHTNNLPLALVPIMHNLKTEGSNISFMFRSSQLLGQWICNIAISRNLANIQLQCVRARAYTNNLPLALVPIMHNPKTKRPNMTIKSWSCQLFG